MCSACWINDGVQVTCSDVRSHAEDVRVAAVLQGDVAAFRAAAATAVYADQNDELYIDELLVRVAYSGGCCKEIEYEIMLSIGYRAILQVGKLFSLSLRCDNYIVTINSPGSSKEVFFTCKLLLRGPRGVLAAHCYPQQSLDFDSTIIEKRI